MSYIYVITNNINGKQYVGKTNDTIEARFKQHLLDSRKQTIENRPLYKAIQKYGEKHFSIKQLEECPYQEANEKEIYWIGKLDTYKNGYNATLGGDGKSYYNYQEIAKIYQQENISIRQLAIKIGCDEHTVLKALRQCNVEIKPAHSFTSKKVAQLNKNTEEIIRIFSSCEEAERSFDKRGGHISQVCQGKRKTANGYKWKYIEE